MKQEITVPAPVLSWAEQGSGYYIQASNIYDGSNHQSLVLK